MSPFPPGFLKSLRRRARPLVAAGTACAFLSLTISGCGHSQVSGAIPAIHYHQDHLSGVALQTGEDGELVAELSNGPWGERLQGSTEPYGFTGKEWESETGLYDFGARLYDPAIGRFLSPDPASIQNPEVGIGDPQRLNPYSYARASPATYVDPDGRCAVGPDGIDCASAALTADTQLAQNIASNKAEGNYGLAAAGAIYRTLNLVNVAAGLAAQALAEPIHATVNLVNAHRSGDYRAIQDAHFRMATLVYFGWLGRVTAARPAAASGTAKLATPNRGRLGNASTRAHVAAVADEMESRGWQITHGGGRFPEEYLPGPGGARKGSSFPDITAMKNGKTLRVNTIDTRANGVTPTTREATNAVRIRAQTDEHLLLIPKPKPE